MPQMPEPVVEYLAKRIGTLQARHNFNPQLGAAQVADHPVLGKAYARFSELVRLVRNFEPELPIPYDPTGLDPLSRQAILESRPVFVYFAREGRSTYWKIGHSYAPPRRRDALQTGNPRTLWIHTRFILLGNHTLEHAIHRYLDRYRIRGRTKEWFDLEYDVVKSLVRRMHNEGEGFLNGPKLRLTPKIVF
jgi:hypothetical protein